MYPFTNIRNAARFALRCKTVALVFDGPGQGGGSGPNFVVALGREARGLERDSHVPYTLQETVRAVGEREAGR